MADDIPDISDFRDAIEGMLLDGEELEATIPTALRLDLSSDSPQVIALTSHRLLLCRRQLKSGSYDCWTFRSVMYAHIVDVEFERSEQFRRDRIDGKTSVRLGFRKERGPMSTGLDLEYRDNAVAR